MRIVTFLVASCLSVEAFSPILLKQNQSVLFAGGFGAGGSTKSDGKKSSSSLSKLKPKQQWDRYLDMKGTVKVPVGVRMKEDDSDAWIQVGYVRSKDDAYTEIAVAMQRALIAEVSWRDRSHVDFRVPLIELTHSTVYRWIKACKASLSTSSL
jgi:hypothetical protein